MHDSIGIPRRSALLAPAAVLAALALSSALLATTPAAAEPVRARFVEAELVSDVKSVEAGKPFRLGLRLAMDPDWHTYWENPGDTGLPTTLDLELPDGFEVGPLRFPYPHRFEQPPYVSYGYEGEVLILADVTPPADLATGESVYVPARAEWTVCREDLCMPGGADLGIELDVAETVEVDRYWTNRIEKDAPLMPATPEGWGVTARAEGKRLVVRLSPDTAHDPGAVEAFERKRGSIDHEVKPSTERDGDAVEITLALASSKTPAHVELVLVAANGWGPDGEPRAIAVTVPVAR